MKKVVNWLEDFAKEVGEVVPVRVRQKTTENAVTKRVTSTLYTFLPSYMTWQTILSEYEKFVANGLERILIPSERSFRRILQRECKKILVRSPRANVCDDCTIYKNTIADAQDAEVFAAHVQTARQMRHVYIEDCNKASESHVVLTMDYSQNLTLPNAASTPSQWYFLSLGHTKNACDRGFGHTRKKFLKTDCWTFDHIVDVVQNSSSSNTCISLENEELLFKDYKTIVDELFSNLQGIQKYQKFRMSNSEPGVVECRRHPFDQPKKFDLRRVYDGTVVTRDRAIMLWDHCAPLARPAVNPEKARDLYAKIRPYVPREFQDCGYYDKPTQNVSEAAKRVKRARVQQQKRQKTAS
ncbi:hypothetical protein LEN26_014889 [Aphanomyces euteiches]|nr:hypothetical protein LEN26_014889 [Aphanomyces euteiches]